MNNNVIFNSNCWYRGDIQADNFPKGTVFYIKEDVSYYGLCGIFRSL